MASTGPAVGRTRGASPGEDAGGRARRADDGPRLDEPGATRGAGGRVRHADDGPRPDEPGATRHGRDGTRPPSEAAIVVRDLHKRYDGFHAIRGIDFAVGRGEVFGLLGPNGAGKTTTVEILEGYRERTSGSVSVLGFDPALRPRELRERVGIVLQSTGIYAHITVREALTHWAGLYPHPRDVEEVLALSGLQAKQHERTRRLSGGQLRRLDLALALIGDPDLIFLDEPTTGFDPAARRAAWDTIRALRALGKTILLTTHYLDEAQALADRVAIIKDGRILAEGSPSELGAGQSTSYRVSYRDAEGLPVSRETDDPTQLLHDLTAVALSRGERLRDLSVVRPTLEDVYLQLTADSGLADVPPPVMSARGGRRRGRMRKRSPSEHGDG